MNAQSVLFRTERFNLSLVKEHIINPDCFGEDMAVWLRDKLMDRGNEVSQLGQEGWGWHLQVKSCNESYFFGVSGIPVEDNERGKEFGEWQIIVKKNRSLGQWLTNKGKIMADDKMLSLVQEILRAEPDFLDVHQQLV